MQRHFLLSTGGRLVHGALALAPTILAFAAFSSPAAVYPGMALGTLVLVGAFIAAALLSIAEYPMHALAIAGGAPLAGFCFVLGSFLVVGRGPTLGWSFAALGALIFVVGFVLPLRGGRARTTQDEPLLDAVSART